LAVLQEAVLKQPFSAIRADFRKTAYASYWAELIYNWIEENFKQVALFHLLEHVLAELDSGRTAPADLNILFQMRLLTLAGYRPNLHRCSVCGNELEKIKQDAIAIDSKRGGIICQKCRAGSGSGTHLGKGTIKQLLWVESGDLAKAVRIKFSQTALMESTGFLEEFVCYHLGKQPRSLKFLRQIRNPRVINDQGQMSNDG
jgi:DNA repair protein RecO (recombination protein O)